MFAGVPPSKLDNRAGMLARAHSSIPKPVLPPIMMTQLLGAIPENVPWGDTPSGL